MSEATFNLNEFQACDSCLFKMRTPTKWQLCKGCSANKEAISSLRKRVMELVAESEKIKAEMGKMIEASGKPNFMEGDDLPEGGASDWYGYSPGARLGPYVNQAPAPKITIKKPGQPTENSFPSILSEMLALHEKKAADYGDDGDVHANLHESADFGVSPWLAAVVRMNDKMRRLKSFTKKGKLENEPIEESLIDIANYSALALMLYREEGNG